MHLVLLCPHHLDDSIEIKNGPEQRFRSLGAATGIDAEQLWKQDLFLDQCLKDYCSYNLRLAFPFSGTP